MGKHTMLHGRDVTLVSILTVCLAICLPAGVGFAGSPPGVTVIVHGHGVGPRGGVAVVAESGDRKVEAGTSMDRGHTARVSLRLGAGATWEVRARAEGWWGPPVTVVAGRQTEATVDLWPTATLKAAVSRTVPSKKPLEISVRLWSPPSAPAGQPELDEETLPCELRAKALSCEIPAGTWDLAVRARGHVSLYRWGVAAPAGGARDLGTLRFVPGASVVGWVRSDVPGVKLERCTVKLLPYRSGDLGPDSSRRMGHLAAAGSPNGRGFFHLTGIKPGRYVLRAEGPGCAPVEVGPFDVLEGSESELRAPILLQEPASLLVTIEPPADPQGRPWIVEVLRATKTQSSRLHAVTRDPASPAGDWKVSALAPGDYTLLVRDRDGAVWASQAATVLPGGNSAFVTIDTVDVCGTVSVGDTPVPARLVFREPWKKTLSASMARMTLESGDDGRFRGVLPHPGRWNVEIDAPGLHVARRYGPVDVVRREGPCASVDIELPDHSLGGVVVREDGTPAAGAKVKAVVLVEGQKGVIHTQTDEDGTFVFRGLDAGEYMASASDGLRRSKAVRVEVPKGGNARDVRLVLEETRHVQGIVLGPAGPVPGAMVMAMAPGQAMASPVTTGPDGGFELDVREPAAAATLMVGPPGHCFHLGRLGAAFEGERAVVHVGQACGDITVRIPSGKEGRWTMLVAEDGATIPVGILHMWDQMNGAPFQDGAGVHLVHLSPGRYGICANPGQSIDMSAQGTPCTEALVTPGVVETVTLKAKE